MRTRRSQSPRGSPLGQARRGARHDFLPCRISPPAPAGPTATASRTTVLARLAIRAPDSARASRSRARPAAGGGCELVAERRRTRSRSPGRSSRPRDDSPAQRARSRAAARRGEADTAARARRSPEREGVWPRSGTSAQGRPAASSNVRSAMHVPLAAARRGIVARDDAMRRRSRRRCPRQRLASQMQRHRRQANTAAQARTAWIRPARHLGGDLRNRGAPRMRRRPRASCRVAPTLPQANWSRNRLAHANRTAKSGRRRRRHRAPASSRRRPRARPRIGHTAPARPPGRRPHPRATMRLRGDAGGGWSAAPPRPLRRRVLAAVVSDAAPASSAAQASARSPGRWPPKNDAMAPGVRRHSGGRRPRRAAQGPAHAARRPAPGWRAPRHRRPNAPEEAARAPPLAELAAPRVAVGRGGAEAPASVAARAAAPRAKLIAPRRCTLRGGPLHWWAVIIAASARRAGRGLVVPEVAKRGELASAAAAARRQTKTRRRTAADRPGCRKRFPRTPRRRRDAVAAGNSPLHGRWRGVRSRTAAQLKSGGRGYRPKATAPATQAWRRPNGASGVRRRGSQRASSEGRAISTPRPARVRRGAGLREGSQRSGCGAPARLCLRLRWTAEGYGTPQDSAKPPHRAAPPAKGGGRAARRPRPPHRRRRRATARARAYAAVSESAAAARRGTRRMRSAPGSSRRHEASPPPRPPREVGAPFKVTGLAIWSAATPARGLSAAAPRCSRRRTGSSRRDGPVERSRTR